jgi:Kef-type K+ transport system membrane component KefB
VVSGSRGGDPSRGGALRLGAFYGVVAMIVAAVVVIVTAVSGEHAMPSIAGSYTASAPNACLGAAPPPFKGEPLPPTALATLPKTGPTFVVQQSGQFVNLTNSRRTLRGQLRLHPAALQGGKHLLTGTVHCVKGGSRRIRALAGSGPKPSFAGTLGGTPLLATFAAPPPAPGAQLPRTPPRIGGTYALSPASTCFGSSFVLTGAGGSRYRLSVATHRLGTVFYTAKTGIVAGDVNCTRGGRVQLTAQANDLQLQNVQLLPLDVAKAVSVVAGGKVHSSQTTASGLPPWGERFTASKGRTEFNKLVVSLFLAIVVVLIVARIFGALAVKVREPRVMGEVIAGILLGPSVLGLISPNLQAMIFPTDILPPFGVAANLGLVFFMFLIGLEVDRAQLRGKGGRAAMISNASVVLPMLLGVLVAIPIYKLLAPDKNFGAFALFVGVSMSITAFPVLARILVERRMLKGPVGALVVACAAIDDVTAWFLIALATTVAVSGSFGSVAETIGEAVAFTLFMAIVVRRLLGRMATAFDEVGHIPSGWFAAIVGGVLVSAFITEEIHIALIFGGFIMGIVMPRHARLTEEVTRRIEDFVVALLLPLFFVYSGLKTNVTLLDRPELWLITLGLIAIAIVGKLVGAALASRVSGMDWRSSAVVGTLMNTRGLTELIVLNIGLEIGVLSNALFAALVLMALVTTLMAGPLLSVLDPRNEFGEKMEDELAIAAREASTEHPALVFPERAILVAPQSDAALEQLLSIAEPLARSQPPRELILVRLLRPARGGGARAGLQTQNLQLEEATRALEATRSRLAEEGVAARSMAIISADAGADLLHIVEREPIDLVLTEGRRRLVGEGLPFGEVGTVLERAPSDVAVLVAREGTPLPLDAEHPVVVPFGGAEHEWAALELGSWLSSTTGAPLKLLGAAASEEDSSVTRMLGDAGLLVQHAAGVAAEPVVITRGREGVVAAASGAGVLVIGLSDRWRREGLGPTRSEIAKAAPAPVLFVRRGTRPGLFAARDSVTRFQWSMAASQVPLVAATDGGDGAGGSDAIGQPEESV